MIEAAPQKPVTEDKNLSHRVQQVEEHYRLTSRFIPESNATAINPMDLPVTQAILKWVGTGRKVLDLGCHWGDITALIRDQGNDVTGMDLPECSAIARARHGIHVINHDLNEAIPMGDSTFDVVVVSSVLDDIPDDLSFLKECRRILIPGGSIIVNVPNEVSWYRRVMCLLGKESRDYNGPTSYHTLNRYTLRGIKALLTKAGFRVVRQAKGPKRYSGLPGRYWIERVLPITFATDLVLEAVKTTDA